MSGNFMFTESIFTRSNSEIYDKIETKKKTGYSISAETKK